MAPSVINLPEFVTLRQSYNVESLINVVYGGSPPEDVPVLLSKLVEAGPRTLDEFIVQISGYKSDLDRLIFLLVSLRSVQGDQQWIHYELAVLFHSLLLMNVAGARMARLVHSNLALVDDRLNDVATAVVQAMLSESLLLAAPLEALIGGARAVRLGRIDQANLVKQAMDSLPKARQEELAEAFAEVMPKPSKPVVTRPLTGVSIHRVTEETPAQLERPARDGEHYIFNPETSPSPALDVYVVNGAYLSVDFRRAGMTEFYVFDKNGTLIPEVSRGQTPFLEEDRIPVGHTVALLDDFFSEVNLCHLLLDKINRMALFDKMGVAYKPMLFRKGDYYDQVFSFLGIDQFHIPSETGRFTARIDQLMVSNGNASGFRHPSQWFPDWATDHLKSRFGTGNPGASKKIFISRTDAPTRRILNQDDVDKVLSEFGYVSHELSGLSFLDQRRLFADASHVVGVHGAGLTNILFSGPGTQVLEILPPLCASAAYWKLASALGQNYHAAIAEDPDFPRPDYKDWTHNAALNSRDVVVDTTLLRNRLTEMDSCPSR